MAEAKEIENLSTLERISGYEFSNKLWLLEAVTHKSHEDAFSGRNYERLEYVGDAVLSGLLSVHFHETYPDATQGDYTKLRAATVNNDTLASVAVKHNLQSYLRHRARELVPSIESFVNDCKKDPNGECSVNVGAPAPKVLADIVESIIAAVFYDTGKDLEKTWKIVEPFLAPIATMNSLSTSPPPMKRQKLATGKTEQATDKMVLQHTSGASKSDALSEGQNTKNGKDQGPLSLTRAKSVLNELCSKRKWGAAVYDVVSEEGPAHEKRFICSVRICVPGSPEPHVCVGESGFEKVKKRAENSAASAMLEKLKTLGLVAVLW